MQTFQNCLSLGISLSLFYPRQLLPLKLLSKWNYKDLSMYFIFVLCKLSIDYQYPSRAKQGVGVFIVAASFGVP